MPRKTVFPDADSDNGSEEENLFGQKDFNKSDLDDSSEEDENENRDFEEGNSGVMDEENSSDDDDVPLEVSKAASKKAANERFANIIEALKTSKAKKKEKRKDRQKLYEKQKVRYLAFELLIQYYTKDFLISQLITTSVILQ